MGDTERVEAEVVVETVRLPPPPLPPPLAIASVLLLMLLLLLLLLLTKRDGVVGWNTDDEGEVEDGGEDGSLYNDDGKGYRADVDWLKGEEAEPSIGIGLLVAVAAPRGDPLAGEKLGSSSVERLPAPKLKTAPGVLSGDDGNAMDAVEDDFTGVKSYDEYLVGNPVGPPLDMLLLPLPPPAAVSSPLVVSLLRVFLSERDARCCCCCC